MIQPTEGRRKKAIQANKKAVPMVMKFRDHTDPLYYDPKANDKILVPAIDEVSLVQ